MTNTAARPTFRKAGFLQEGYAVTDVDDFVNEVFAAIAAGGQVPDIVTARFATTRRGGYDMAEVDEFLDEVHAGLGGTAAPLTDSEAAQEAWLRDWLDGHRS